MVIARPIVARLESPPPAACWASRSAIGTSSTVPVAPYISEKP
jgi:hypothetical protein